MRAGRSQEGRVPAEIVQGPLAERERRAREPRFRPTPQKELPIHSPAKFRGFTTPDNLALSEPTGTLFVRPGPFPAPGVVHSFDINRLIRNDDRTLPSGNGGPILLAGAPGRPDIYVGTVDPTFAVGRLERLSRPGVPIPDSGRITFFDGTSQSLSLLPRALLVTPPAGVGSLLPDTAYVSFDTFVADGVHLVSIQGVRNFNAATVTDIDTHAGRATKPTYLAFAPAPGAGGEKIFALHAAGIDSIKTTNNNVVANALTFPSGFTLPTAMAAGKTAGGSKLIFVVSRDRLLVYDTPTATPIGDVALPGDVLSVHLSLDGRFLLLTRFSRTVPFQSLLVLDADTRLTIRDSLLGNCPPSSPCNFAEGATPMALTIDGAHAIAANPNFNELDDIYLTSPRLVVASECLIRVTKAVPIDLFPDPQDKQRLINHAKDVRGFLLQAEQAPDGATRQAALSAASVELKKLMKKVDGCFGGIQATTYSLTAARRQTSPTWQLHCSP